MYFYVMWQSAYNKNSQFVIYHEINILGKSELLLCVAY